MSCGHVAPIVIRGRGSVDDLNLPVGRGLGGRGSPRPSELATTLEPGDRLVMCSDGVVTAGSGQAGLGEQGVVEAALRSEQGSAADTVRQVIERCSQRAGTICVTTPQSSACPSNDLLDR